MNCEGGAIDTGDTGFMLLCTAFVMLQTPAMGIAQAGMIRRKHALSMMMQTITGLVIGSLLWWLFGYGMTFGPSAGGFIGDFRGAVFAAADVPWDDCIPGMTIPALLFAAFQMMFALMVPVIITGAWAEKMTMEAFLIFVTLWPILVYYFVAHWVWNGDGFLAQEGVLDFAGGITIHTPTGVSAIVVSTMLQRRKRTHELVGARARHSTPLFFVGATFIWVGWYSFNGGSAFAANGTAVLALTNTHLGACAGALAWVVLAKVRSKKWHLAEIFSGALAGLACITPGSGFVHPWSSVVIGLIGGCVSFGTSIVFKERFMWDDVLDVGSLQGSAGFTGSILLGFFSFDYGVFYGHGGRFLAFQLAAALLSAAWAGFWTFMIMWFIKHTVSINISVEQEEVGLDLTQIGEQAYDEKVSLLVEYNKQELDAKLLEAVVEGELAEVRQFINAGANPCSSDWDFRSAAHLAASEGHLDILRYLVLVHGADQNAKDHQNKTPLDDALANNRRQCIEWLRKHKAEFDKDALVEEILDSCANGDSLRVNHVLRSKLLDLDEVADYDMRTPLHVAAANGHTKVVATLMRNGAALDVKDRWKRTPYEEARMMNNKKVMRVLEKYKEKRGKSGDALKIKIDPAHSRHSSHHSVSRFTLSHASETKDDGKDVIELGTMSTKGLSEEEVASMKLNSRELCIASSCGDLAEIKRLVRKGANVNAWDYDGRVAAHLAARAGHLDVLKYLVKHGANVNAQDRWRVTPLQEAIRSGQVDVMKFLRSHGAVVKDRAVGHRLCSLAASGNMERLEEEYAAGVDMNTADYDGRTALHLAAANGRTEIVEWLLLLPNANPNVCDRYKNTPLDDVLSLERDTAIVEALKSKGGVHGRNIGDKEALASLEVKEPSSNSPEVSVEIDEHDDDEEERTGDADINDVPSEAKKEN